MEFAWRLIGWTGAKGAREIFLSFFYYAQKIFLWIYTFQAILRPFHPYNFLLQNFEIFYKSHFKFLKN
jgi:hypothetical protein